MKGTIIYWGNFELPDKNASANRVVSNGKIFTKLGYRVIFLGTKTTEQYFAGVQQTDYNSNMYEECYPASTKLWLKYVFDISTVQSLIEKYTDIKLVIAYNIPYSKFRNLKKQLKKENIRAVYDCTEWNDLTDGNVLKRLYKKLDLYQIKHYLDKKADGLIVISKRMEQYYQNKNIVRIPPLIDIEDGIWHQPEKKHSDRFEFCFAGTISNKEALDKVIDAFVCLNKDMYFIRIIGLTKQDLQQMYPELTDIIDNKNLIFMGQLSHNETVKYVQNCDCYIFLRYDNPRNQAGFPTKFVESYSCGVPIITTDVSDIGMYMRKSEAGIVLDSLSKETIMSAMKTVFEKNFREKSIRFDFDFNNYLDSVSVWIDQIISGGMMNGEKR